jgi:hypothetical protein
MLAGMTVWTFSLAKTIALAFGIIYTIVGVVGYLRLFGIILLLIGILGFIGPIKTRIDSFVPIGGWDRWPHLVSGVIMLWGASTAGKAAQPA